MKVIQLTAENFKRLVAVDITPTANLVQITGKNGQGKTSILDAIWAALAGASVAPKEPIRKGATEARIRLDLGEIRVTRTFRRKEEGGATTSIVVENADGARFPSPQKMLDSLLGALCFDPLAFARADPKGQFDTLRQFVPGVDFEAIEAQNRTDYQRRTDLNRRAKEFHAAAATITVPAGTPDAPVDESALIAELTAAGDANADVERRKAARQGVQNDANHKKAEGVSLRNRAADLRAQADEADRIASARLNEAAALELRLDNAGPLPAPADTADINRRIAGAREINRAVAARVSRDTAIGEAQKIEQQAEALTQQMEQRTADKLAAIAAAQMPVDGISFGDGTVLLNGLPFEQASDAEQLQTSVRIAMALDPKLRVIRIRDGSLLDDDAMRLLAQMADAADMQVWIERVDGSGKIGFVIEDGHLRAAASEQSEQAA